MGFKRWEIPILIFLMLLSLAVRMVGFRYPYLRNIDSYLFWRYMNYTLEAGKVPDFDPLMLAPTGKDISKQPMFYVWLGAKTYELTRMVADIPLWKYLVYFPAVLASLMAIPAYIIGSELFGKRTGLIFAFMVLFSPTIMSRTLGGDPDSDAIVLLMSLLTISSFLPALKRRSITLSILAGAVFAVFSWTWVGFWYVWWLATGYAVLEFLLTRDRKILHSFAALNISFFILSYLITGREMLSYVLLSPFKTIGLFGMGGIKAEEGQFPNVYVSVAEMQSNTLSSLVRQVGGYLFFPSIFALAYLAWRYYKHKEGREGLLLSGLWLVGFLYASIVAVRFAIFLVLPMALLTSYLIDRALSWAEGD